MNDTVKTWLSIEEASKHVGIGKTVLYGLARQGRIPAFRVGKKWTFEKSRLDAWARSKHSPETFLTSLECNIEANARLNEPQRESYLRTNEFFQAGKSRAILQIPPGCGKTGLISILPFGLAKGRVLVVAPNAMAKDRLYEAMDTTNRSCFWRKTGVLTDAQMASGPVVSTLDGGNLSGAAQSHIFITDIQQLSTDVEQRMEQLPTTFFDLIVVDEAHRADASGNWQKVLEKFSTAKRIGLTATPLRSVSSEVDGELAYRYPFRNAALKGYIKRLKASYVAPPTVELGFRDSHGRLYELNEVLELKEADWLSRGVALTPLCDQHIVDSSLEKLEELRQTGTRHQLVAVACSIEHACDIRSLYVQRGYATDIIHGKQDPQEQQKVLAGLNNRTLDCIVQVQMPGEGFDDPHLSVAAIFRPFYTLLPFVQFVGQIMRAVVQDEPTHPDNVGHIVTHLGMNLDQLLQEFKQFERDDKAFWQSVIGSSEPEAPQSTSGGGLEREVARIYALLGAETQQRLMINHYEIDVHATLLRGPFRISFVVECKEYGAGRAVSAIDMLHFVAKLGAARQRGLADKGIFVTTSSFTKDAHATAAQHGVQCLLLHDLQNQLVDFQPYLSELIQKFDSSSLGHWYVDQTLSELEDYDALSSTDRARVLHGPAIQYLDQRFEAPQQKPLALLGNIGTGKSSLCRAYRAHLARAALMDSSARIPLLVDLRDSRAGMDIHQLIVDSLRRLPGVNVNLPVYLELQRLGRFFFLLDGLDEMASRVDRAVINENLREIDRLRTDGDNRYIVTCRTHFFQERVLDEFLTDYDVLYLTEWSNAQIHAYCSHRLGNHGEPQYQRIVSNARYADLATIPLLLALLLETGELDTQDSNGYKLLTHYTDRWIVMQSRRRGAVMTSQQRRRFMLTLASHMYIHNVRQLHFSELYEVAREFCGHGDAGRIDHFDVDARTCTFITRDSKGNYSFRHQGFLDYFSASAIADALEAGDHALLGMRELDSQVVDLIVERGVTRAGVTHLQTWAADSAPQALTSNATRLLTCLGET